MTFEKTDSGPAVAIIEFNYHARGFCCSNCSTGLSLDRKECPHCGARLINPYEVAINDKVCVFPKEY